ncbi:DnaJ domain-containing protein [Halostella salina]|uniref:DnaJ domain-containing protein n=1 Tax=Halostella salina TaxID=1547897 RepID=UPI000EF80B8D|nr:DnaJ domain-containing protein [Halostella salina]
MSKETLLVGLAAVFAGLAAVLGILTLVRMNPFVLILAAPFAFVAYLLWYQGTGRLAEQAQRRADRGEFRDRRESGFGAGARRAARESRGQREARQRYEARFGGRTAASDGAGRTGPQPSPGPSASEAATVLGVSPDAGDDEVRRAYREKVKDVHPDAPDGDEERFKRVQRAYDRLQGDPESDRVSR